MSDLLTQLYETADDAQLDWKWPNFTAAEFRCNGTGRVLVSPSFMDKLQSIRIAFNAPMIVTSGYRSPTYNETVSTTGPDGPHTTGHAVDIAVRGADAIKLIQIAITFGMTGIGLKQHGTSRYVHLDDLPNDPVRCPRPTIWSYP